MSKTNRRLSALLMTLAALVGWHGCSSDDFRMSETFINSGTYVECVDSVTLNLSTFKLDSVVTSHQGIVWAGAFEKKGLGTFNSESYFKLSEPSTYGWTKNERYDSITVTIYHTGDYEGDTVQDATLTIERVSQQIVKTDGQTYFYNNDCYPTSDTLGTYTYRPQPHAKPKRVFRISDDFGQELFEFIHTTSVNTSNSADKFKQYLHGLKFSLKAHSTPLMLAYKSDSISLCLHTHYNYSTPLRVTRQLTISDKGYQFNNTWTSNVPEALQVLDQEDVGVSRRIPAALTDSCTLMMEGAGYYTAISFPSLGYLLPYINYGHFLRAELLIYPDVESYSLHRLPSTFYLTRLNRENATSTPVYNSMRGQASATLVRNADNVEGTYYYVDVTYFINTLLSQEYLDEKEAVVLTWGTAMDPTNFYCLRFNGENKKRYKSKLRLYYYNYDKEGN